MTLMEGKDASKQRHKYLSLGKLLNGDVDLAEDTVMRLQLKTHLRSLMQDRGVTIATLAKKTGISRKTLENWLVGQKPQNIEQVKIVANFLQVSLDEICFGTKANGSSPRSELEDHRDEINAGIFEVVLRRIKK